MCAALDVEGAINRWRRRNERALALLEDWQHDAQSSLFLIVSLELADVDLLAGFEGAAANATPEEELCTDAQEALLLAAFSAVRVGSGWGKHQESGPSNSPSQAPLPPPCAMTVVGNCRDHHHDRWSLRTSLFGTAWSVAAETLSAARWSVEREIFAGGLSPPVAWSSDGGDRAACPLAMLPTDLLRRIVRLAFDGGEFDPQGRRDEEGREVRWPRSVSLGDLAIGGSGGWLPTRAPAVLLLKLAGEIGVRAVAVMPQMTSPRQKALWSGGAVVQQLLRALLPRLHLLKKDGIGPHSISTLRTVQANSLDEDDLTELFAALYPFCG
jgi:hypothetical protein